MSQQQWIKLTNKFTSRCVQCGEWINKGETVLWLKGLGIKHEECPIGIQEDESSLVVIDDYDKQMGSVNSSSEIISVKKCRVF